LTEEFTMTQATKRRFFQLTAALAAAPALATSLAARGAAPAATPRAVGTIRLKDRTELFVKDWGHGRPVVLTHAWPLSSDCWDQIAIALVDAGYRVIAYDRRGFGRSSQPDGGYTYDQFADDLAEVLAAAGARDAALVGFSMGGGEIVRYMSRHRGRRVKQVGLVATVVPGLAKGPNNPQGVDPAFFDTLKDGLRKDRLGFFTGLLRDVFYDVQASARSTVPVSQAVVDWSLQMGMQAGLRALIGSVDAFGKEDFEPDLAAVNVPTLILHGDADKPTPLELTGRRAAKGIAQSTLIEYAGATHGLLVTERERVTRDLLAFLAA
jgi:pimeloyl-ACP methyl ester carboxylesterase